MAEKGVTISQRTKIIDKARRISELTPLHCLSTNDAHHLHTLPRWVVSYVPYKTMPISNLRSDSRAQKKNENFPD